MSTAVMTEVIETIREEATRLREFLAALPADAWSRSSACTGWAVSDVFAHLAQGARTWSAAMTRALAGDSSVPAGEQALRPGERGSEATAQRAITFREELGRAGLLQAFDESHAHLHRVLLTVQPTDWERPCYHRRGNMSVRDYATLRLQELVIHGWDIRSAFDVTATLSERALPLLRRPVQRWLTHAFKPAAGLAGPVRYRFETAELSVLPYDIVVSPEGLRLESVTAQRADVTFRCTPGDALLLLYGRLAFAQATASGWLETLGEASQAALFPTLWQGF